MPKNDNLWYRLGYALESARSRVPDALPEEEVLPASGGDASSDVSHKVFDALMTVGAGSVLTKILSAWPSRKAPGIFRLFRGGAAGAAAAFLAELARPALTGRSPEEPMEARLTDVLLTGAGRGLLYAVLVEPRIPGHPLLRGVTFGGLQYALMPWGGLAKLAGSRTPQGKVPALSVLLEDRGDEEEVIEHIAFGVALALLYDR
jgi:hypothetical protein